MKRRILGLSFIALTAHMGNVFAQQARLDPGTEVRLVVSPSNDIRGELLSLDADSLRVQDSGSGFVHVVPTFDIERLRVSEPRTRGRGALRGFVIGSIVGALTLGTVAAASPCEALCFPAGEVFLLGAALGGAVGGGSGAAIGAAWPGTRWVDVATPFAGGGGALSPVSAASRRNP